MKPDLKFPQSARFQSRQRGMTLIEVLVTLVIMSVGLLGVAALQLASLRSNYDAYVRSQAAVLASDILDRMRANRGVALTNGYVIGIGGHTAVTTPAERDITDWKSTLKSQLPGGDGEISRLEANGTLTVTVQWGERGGAPLKFTTRSAI